MTLGEYLSANDMTRSEFAARIRLSEASVSRIARGLQKPDLDTAFDIERETGGAVPASQYASPGAGESRRSNGRSSKTGRYVATAKASPRKTARLHRKQPLPRLTNGTTKRAAGAGRR
jgi:transcriptional regulator with XRE-family HTH domain